MKTTILINALKRIQKNCCSWDSDKKPDKECTSDECVSAQIAYTALRNFKLSQKRGPRR